ncbi:UpxZ family transcription anti-terminator antagonist [Bacteroides thetaiotaomicron]|uniref:UpxZ family transcription anti-terminator antagonist n=1 Tax=Bacteroides thetaiotaomicron TaxID=818 RepID=UPI0035B2360C
MVSFLLQENIDELQHLADHLLHIGDKNGYVYADDLSALQQSIHEKINDLYSQRGGDTGAGCYPVFGHPSGI